MFKNEYPLKNLTKFITLNLNRGLNEYFFTNEKKKNCQLYRNSRFFYRNNSEFFNLPEEKHLTLGGVSVKNLFFFFKFFQFLDRSKLYAISSSFIFFVKFFIEISVWGKLRTLYYLSNWVYTTNHKRIAVNYFWFVILSGIVGMVLATVIRLEFAYPGVGIFAGDSLQYLSLVTAHGVVMVFFMIMPLLFGAFANFLLPTQLGVHDVAFPRLNSAAFWFLPGGLLMLAQLVCVDRRYQRMNCFNIREIQSILKRRFFTDLINEHEVNKSLHQTMSKLKYKINDSGAIEPNFGYFYKYGVSSLGRSRNFFFDYTSQNLRADSLTSNKPFLHNTAYLSKLSTTPTFINELVLPAISFFQNSKALCASSGISFILCNVFYTFFFALQDFSFKATAILLKITHPASFLIDFFYAINFITSTIISGVLFLILTLTGIRQTVNSIFSHSSGLENLIKRDKIESLDKQFTLFTRLRLSDFFLPLNDTGHVFFLKLIGLRLKTLCSEISFFFFTKAAKPENNNFFFKDKASMLKRKNDTHSHLSLVYQNLDYSNTSFSKVERLHSDSVEFYTYFRYNSYFIYLYLAIYSFFILIQETVKLLFNFYSFKKMSETVNDVNELLISWYIPLLVSDNVFYVFWQKISILKQFFEGLYGFNTDESTYLNLREQVLLTFKFFFSDVWVKNLTTGDEINTLKNNLFCATFLKPIKQSTLLQVTNLLFNQTNFFLTASFYKFVSWTRHPLTTNELTKPFLTSYTGDLFFGQFIDKITINNEEIFSNYRYHRFDNPIFKYDYKSGDYYPKLYKEAYSFLFSSSNDLTGGLRAAPWFFSSNYSETLDTNFLSYVRNLDFTTSMHSWSESRFLHSSAFYNFFYVLSRENLYFNKRWLSFSAIDQKFYKFFHSSSMQQRIYNNWRQLKFTRESWRCKLLMARHQKTLYKRYVNEDGVFWSIERNAKDLLPGWAMITPFSSRTRFTAVGKVDIGLMGVLLVLNSSIISGANFLVTYRYLSTLNNRKMRDARAFFTEAVMVSSWMMIAANPMLVIGIIMLLSDRHWQTSFFDYSGGGDTVLFQHMFWFFGHPEVYVIIIPTFGFTNTMLSYYLKKRISARASLIYSMYTIAFLGFFVWGHHMYMVGLAHTTRMLFSTLTVMISVPAATKLMHWCVTTVNSSFAMELPLVCTFTFVFLFTSGGISGMCVAHTGMDILFHDTFYVIGHFHVMLAGGAMIACFGAFYFYFVAIFGVKYSRIYAYLHFVYYLLGQLFTVIPMFWLGYAGMPRRVLDYPSSFGGWHSVISGGHMLSVAGLIAFFIMIFDSLRQAKAATRNTFGIGRYNTRLNFYLFELAKLNNIQQKAWSLFRFSHIRSLKLNNLSFYNLEHYESTLFSYVFSKK